ncbi:hypothetical protein ASC75_23890 [Aminobacter sp. DSM 101952]|nr:hypothetical protein ASC75_23890 [Aminobacter sp. DSM 101952]
MEMYASHRDRQSAYSKDGQGTTVPDLAVAAAQAWNSARQRTLALCRRQQKLEGKLARIAGFPETEQIHATSPTLYKRSDAARQTRWQIKDAQLGYSRAKEAESVPLIHSKKFLSSLRQRPQERLKALSPSSKSFCLKARSVTTTLNFRGLTLDLSSTT